jgi:hypothetical protein
VRIQDPALTLGSSVKESTRVTAYYIPGPAIEEVGGK